MSEISKVRLLNVPLENDYKNTLYFSDKTSQQNYFAGKVKKTLENFSYLRKDNVISVDIAYDDLIGYNYVMYQNTRQTNKWYYAFITKLEYRNDSTTWIHIQTDVMQTWLLDEDYSVLPSFVEREHVDNDTVGLHTVPEGLETGEYICNAVSKDEQLKEMSYIIMVSEYMPGADGADNPDKPLAVNYGGVFSAGGAYICTTMREVVNIIQTYQSGKADAILGVYMAPTKIINNSSGAAQYSGQESPVVYEHSVTKQTTLNGYTPTNNKLLCYPYNYLLHSNNSGSANILKYELFSTTDCKFEVEGVPTIGGSIKCVPKNYKGADVLQEEGLMLGKFPTLSWSEDLYTNWLTQNAVNIGIGVASAGLNIVGGLGLMATGGGAGAGAGMLASGTLGIASTLGQIYQHEMIPNTAKGNVNGGDINTSHKMNLFHFYKMSIKSEYAKIIDKYFDMFGYKVNMLKVPNKNHRARYWFTKTIDVNINGAIPNDDLQQIKNCYNNGITFWRSDSEVDNYNVTNNII